jgi:peptide/nickel transport system permease protein
MNLSEALRAPELEHLMGTDSIGRDMFSRTISAARVSLGSAVVASLIGILCGGIIGLLSGYFGGWLDTALMRLIDILLAFPSLLLALAVVAIMGRGLTNAIIAIGITTIPIYARIVRASVLSERERLYVEAARSIGCGDIYMITRHIVPNILAPVIVIGTLDMGVAILWLASLSFLGLGAQPPTAEWGALLNDGRQYMRLAWWLTVFPGVAIMVSVLSFNLIGDGLRAALDPRVARLATAKQ